MASKWTKADYDIDNLLVFINKTLNHYKSADFGKLTKVAKDSGLSIKNLSDYSIKYGPGNNPKIRTFYKVLQGILGRPPIILDPPAIDDLTARRVQAILSGPRADLFKLFLEVLHAGELLKPEEISKVEAYLDMLQTVLRARKSPEPAAPGADCSPSSAA